MPASKHHSKKRSSSQRRKDVNIRKSFEKYRQSPKRKEEVDTMSVSEQDAKFDRVFPTKLLRRGGVGND